MSYRTASLATALALFASFCLLGFMPCTRRRKTKGSCQADEFFNGKEPRRLGRPEGVLERQDGAIVGSTAQGASPSTRFLWQQANVTATPN